MNINSAASMMGANIDMFTLILIWLPAKSLMRFKSVSRQCRELISSPHFQQFRRSKLHGAQIFLSKLLELDFLSLHKRYVAPMTDTLSHLSMLIDVGRVCSFHSSNGLAVIGFEFESVVNFLVYNLATGQHRFIAQPLFVSIFERDGDGDDGHDYEFIDINIGFDPSRSNEYKLVYIWRKVNRVYFALYESDTRSWRECAYEIVLENDEESDFFKIDVMFSRGVLWNGNFHWISKWEMSFYCLDLPTGDERSMPELPLQNAPESELEYDPSNLPDTFFFGVLGGDLSVIVLHDDLRSLQVLKMEPDYSMWGVKYSLDLVPLITRHPSILNDDIESTISVLDVLADPKEMFIVSIPNNLIVICDIEGRVVKEIDDYSVQIEVAGRRWWEAFQYHETIVPV